MDGERATEFTPFYTELAEIAKLKVTSLFYFYPIIQPCVNSCTIWWFNAKLALKFLLYYYHYARLPNISVGLQIAH